MSYIMQPYDAAIEYVLKNGSKKSNRTGIDTLSVFGYQCRYDISTHFPLLTKRKMFPKSIFAELLWILSGSTDVNDLEKMGSKIWSPWRDKQFEEKNKYGDGWLGPIYGWQLRHFGAKYPQTSGMKELDKETFEEAGGFDQLKYVVDELKTNKFSRRIIFSYWNPSDVTSNKARLPPCHAFFQLNVDNDNCLSGMLTQRSADLPLGVPANIQFYSALIYMLAQQCDLKPKEFIHAIGDLHIYENQIDPIKEYLSRPEVESPKLNLLMAENICSYKQFDFEIENYNPLDKITIPVAV